MAHNIQFPLPTLIQAIVAFLPICFLSTFVHELGHAVIAKVNGFVVTSFGTGIAKPLAVWKWGDTRIFICLARPSLGLTMWQYPSIYSPRKQIVAVFAGGILANAILAVIGFLLWTWLPWGAGIWLVLALINLLAVFNLVPLQYRAGSLTVWSDGMHILQACRGRANSMPAPARIQSTRVVARLCQAIGDNAGLFLLRLQEVLAWLELGIQESAQVAYSELASTPVAKTPLWEGLDALALAYIGIGGGQADTVERSLNIVEDRFSGIDPEMGKLLSALARIDFAVAQGDAKAALGVLNPLTDSRQVKGRPMLQAEVAAARLITDASLGVDNIASVRDACERDFSRSPSLTRDLRVYPALGRYYAKREEWQSAAAVYEHVLAAASELAAGFRDRSDQETFLKTQGGLIAEAGDCFRRLGPAAEQDKYQQALALSTYFKRQRDWALRTRSRRHNRWGLAITLFNVVCAAVVFALAAAMRRQAAAGTGTEPLLLLLSFVASVALFTTVIVLFRVVLFTLSLVRRDLRGAGGTATLVLSIAPWPTCLIVFLTSWIG
jgi:hypothetical protein